MKTISKFQSDIKESKQKLAKLRTQKDISNEKLIRLKQEIEAKEKKSGKKLPSSDPLVSRLESVSNEIKIQTQEINILSKRNDKLIEDMSAKIPVKDRLANLSSDIPILLLPVRLQTRFMCVKHVAKGINAKEVIDINEVTNRERNRVKKSLGELNVNLGGSRLEVPTRMLPLPNGKTNKKPRTNIPSILPSEKPKQGFEKIQDKDELWVRIYPDDIFVHTHEDCLTKAELKSAEFFWNEIYQADNQGLSSDERKNLKIGAWRALVGSYGTPRASYIVKKTRPKDTSINEGQPILKVKPELPTIVTKESSWTKAPCTYMMPDQFVVRLYSGSKFREVLTNPIRDTLILGLDPESENADDFELNGQERKIPENIKWLTEFDYAEKVGMAIRIPLSPKEKKAGFSKIVVLGVKSSMNAKDSQKQLEKLLENHSYGAGGMALLKQGTPTNNTSKDDSAYNSSEIDSKLSFENVLSDPLFKDVSVRSNRKDGEFITKALGVNASIFNHIENADSTDIAESIAMNRALYPATLGYSLQQFHANNVNKNSRKLTRRYFENYVLGRGSIPTFRIDRQPYGIIPTTAFSRWNYDPKDSFETHLRGLHKSALVPFKSYWHEAVDQVNYMTSSKVKAGNFSDIFLDVLGLHASSVDYYQRFVAGPQASQNRLDRLKLLSKAQENINHWITKFSFSAGHTFNYTFLEQAKKLVGPLVDGLTLSEKRGIKSRKGINKNYIDFLIECSIEQIRKENFEAFSPEDKVPPHALLYLMLRHALLRESLNIGYDLLAEANVSNTFSAVDFELDQLTLDGSLRPEHEAYLTEITLANYLPQIASEATLSAEKKLEKNISIEKKQEYVTNYIANGVAKVKDEIAFEVSRQKAAFKVEKDKFECFKKSFPALTGRLTLSDYILKLKEQKSGKTKTLSKMQSSLDKLKDLPTARLERCFAEHIDCCSYRIDAWQQGLVTYQLEQKRKTNEEGIYLGAFAILEKLKPQGKSGIYVQEVKSPKLVDVSGNSGNTVNPVIDCSLFTSRRSINAFLKSSFIYLGDDPIPEVEYDMATKQFIPAPVVNKNVSEGFIHAPTTSQAITAAILKGGYDAHRKNNSATETLAVNLTSKRVRTAIYYLQGMRNGQAIAQLLGYQFERALHDTTTNSLNHLLLEFRNEFPYTVDPVIGSASSNAEAYHVVDGLALLKEYQEKGISGSRIKSVFNTAGTVPQSEKDAVESILKELDQAMDSVNDLMIAESVFQVVVGSPEASSAALKVLSESGEITQMPEVTKIPRLGLTVNHRVGIQIPISSSSVAWTTNKATARSKVSRNINSWLEKQLPAPDKICVRVRLNDGSSIKEVSMKDIGIEPIDFVQFLATQDQNPQNGYIPAMVKCHLHSKDSSIDKNDKLTLLFEDGKFRSSTKICLFEIMPLVRSLYNMLSSSRSVLPEDLMEQSKANSDDSSLGSINNRHLSNCLVDLVNGNGSDSLLKIKTTLENALLSLTPITTDDQQLTNAEFSTYLNLVKALLNATTYNIPAAVPNLDQGFNIISRTTLVNQVEHVIKLLDKFKTYGSTKLQEITDQALTGKEQYEALKEIAEQLFGRACFIYPEFTIDNHAEFDVARHSTEILANADKYAVEDWLLGASVVRPRLKNYQILKYLREVFSTADKNKNVEIAQLPFVPGANNRWLALDIIDKESIPLDPISMAFEYPDGYTSNTKQMAFIIDEWTEIIPEDTLDTGIALHYNRPNNEASQNLLLAIPPDNKDKHWKWEDLVDAVDETLTLAKIRAVEPDHLRSNPLLFRTLPATVAAVNAEGNTPSLDYGRNNYIPFVFIPQLIDFQFIQLAQDG